MEHATLRSELAAFESDYLRQVGVVDMQVQELEAKILAIVAARSGAVEDPPPPTPPSSASARRRPR